MHRICLAAGVMLAASGPAWADIAVTSNDAHTILENGKQVAAPNPPPDTVSVIEFGKGAPRIVASVEAPGSVVGPPMSVAVAQDGSFAVAASSTRRDPQDPSRIIPDDRISVIDLTARPVRVTQTLASGKGAASVRISPDGRLVLVANRGEGTVSAFAIRDRRLEPLQKLDLDNPKSGPSGLAFTRDGRTALVSRDSDNRVSVIRIEEGKLQLEKRPITTGIRPYTVDVDAAGTLAAVSNMGRGDGDIDTVSLIDLTHEPFHAVETVGVGRGPEGLKFSPDGRFLAVGMQEGTTQPPGSPMNTARGRLALYAVQGGHLRRLAEAPVGGWSQGIAFSRDGRTILVESMLGRGIDSFHWDGRTLTPAGHLPLGTGPAAIRTAWP